MERKKAIEVVKSNLIDISSTMLFEALETLIPELKESEDEIIRKWIIDDIKYNMNEKPLLTTEYKRKAKKAIAWLERQGEGVPSKETILNVWDLGNIWKELTGCMCDTEHGTQLDYIIKHWKDGEHYIKQGGQEADDKVEPKFKHGDWIVCDEIDFAAKIIGIDSGRYEVESFDGSTRFPNIGFVDRNFHLWTIRDAKAGDVLVNHNDEVPFIFKGFLNPDHPDYPVAYCGIDDAGKFKICSGNHFWEDSNVKPATKEQRDLLFSKMCEAGYEWDAGNKIFMQLF